MLSHTKYLCVVTGTRLIITEQDIVDEKRNFRLYPYTYFNSPKKERILMTKRMQI